VFGRTVVTGVLAPCAVAWFNVFNFRFLSDRCAETPVCAKQAIVCGSPANILVGKINAHPLCEDPNMCGAVHKNPKLTVPCFERTPSVKTPEICDVVENHKRTWRHFVRVHGIAATRSQDNQQTSWKLHRSSQRRV